MMTTLTYKGLSGRDWFILRNDDLILSNPKTHKGTKQPNILPRGSIVVSKQVIVTKVITSKLSVNCYDYEECNVRCNLGNLERVRKDELEWLLPIDDPRLRHCVFFNKNWWSERHSLKPNESVIYVRHNANTPGTILEIGTPKHRENTWILLLLYEV